MAAGEDRPFLMVLLGPTASGKSGLGARWAERLGGEIVSADSVQVYRYMDIGTAKPPLEMRQRIAHHLIDVVDPDEGYSAARFQAEADEAIQGIYARGKIPLVVGGTGLYIKALTRGLFEGPGGDRRLRRRLHEELETRGVVALHRKLEGVDPLAARRIHPQDRFRIVRALEVYSLTGIPISDHHQLHGFSQERYRALYLGLALDRRSMYQRIDQRVEEMIDRGLVQEVGDLLNRGYGPDLPSMQAIGYRHIGRYLLGKASLDESIESMKRETRHYAKRQMTWFRRIPDIRWFGHQDEREIFEELQGLPFSPHKDLDNLGEGC